MGGQMAGVTKTMEDREVAKSQNLYGKRAVVGLKTMKIEIEGLGSRSERGRCPNTCGNGFGQG